MPKKLTLEEVKERLLKINPNIEILSNEYLGSGKKLNCRCRVDKYEWKVTWESLKQRTGCPKCTNHITLTLNEVKYKLSTINPNIEIIDDKYINSSKKLRCKCKLDGYEWKVDWHALNRGQGCPVCSKHVVSLGINTLWDINKDMVIKYKIDENFAKSNSANTKNKTVFTCPDCGKKKSCSVCCINKYGLRCICNSDGASKGHKYVHSMLEQLGLSFLENKSPKWCIFYNHFKNKMRKGEYDFVIENLKLIIEVDGSFHRIDNNISGQTVEESIFYDNEKDRLAKENGYDIIRIMYDDDKLIIKDYILESKLNKIFDLSNINWKKCEEFSLSSRIKEACELKRKNPDITSSEVARIMNITKTTVKLYLKQGAELNWCDYNPKEEMIKSGKKSKNRNTKRVKILKNNFVIGVFSSASELSNKSKELFGVHLLDSKIGSVCSEKRKTHKGFTFQYATKEEYEEWIKIE